MDLKKQIDRDLCNKLLSGMKKQLTHYHTSADIAEISPEEQVSSMIVCIQILFLQTAIAAGFSKEVVMNAISNGYDVAMRELSHHDHS